MNDLPNDGRPADDDSPAKETPLPAAVEVPGTVHDEASAIAGETLEQVGAAGGEAPPLAPAQNPKELPDVRLFWSGPAY